MELSLSKFVLFLLLFHVVVNQNEIENFQKVYFHKGITDYKYKYVKPILQDEQQKEIYFFFKFSNSLSFTLTFTINDENQKEIYSDKVLFDDLYFKVTSLKSQTFTFSLKKSIDILDREIEMIFIDNSKEINMNLDTFFVSSEFIFSDKIKDGQPLPLIFNIDSIKEKTSILFKKYDNNQEFHFDFCEINENGNKCEYTENIDRICFEKEKRYKIKYHSFSSGLLKKNYYFPKYSINIFREVVGMGLNRFKAENIENLYYIIDIQNKYNFHIYGDYNENKNKFETTFITEEEKNNVFNNFEETPFSFDSTDSNSCQQVINMTKSEPYLFIKFNSDSLKTSDYYKKIEGSIYIFSSYREIQYDTTFELEKGEYGLIKKTKKLLNKKRYALVSSNSNMCLFDSFDDEDLTNLIFINDNIINNVLVYIDSTKEKTIINYYTYSETMDDSEFKVDINFITNNNLNQYLNKYGPDSLFMRTTSNHIDFDFNSTYFFGNHEKYYLFKKKYYGNIEFYKYNKELNVFTNISLFQNSYHLYNNFEEYDLINNELLIISGFQLFSFFNTYGSLYDLYFQKVDDSESITINKEMFPFNNLVKLLNPNKNYYLNFEVDHLIKLDNKFLDAEVTFIDKKGKKYILNSNKKIITDLKGENIFVSSNKKALLYFYKKINDYSNINVIEFDKAQTGKYIKIHISSENIKNNININVVKDFGFEGYYPMLSEKNWNKIDSMETNAVIYAENLYDKLEEEIYEKDGEKYYIYIFNSENNESGSYKIEKKEYLSNLLTPKNKFNLEVIEANSKGSIILDVINKHEINYQFFVCNNDEIDFIIENSKGYFESDSSTNYPYKKTIKTDEEISLDLNNDNNENNNDILQHSFNSDNEFVFAYSFKKTKDLNKCEENENYSILLSINELNENNIQLKFFPKYKNCLNQHHIIIAIKDNNNNNETFSDPCYLSKLLTQESKGSYITKSFYDDSDVVINNIDISELNKEQNSKLVINLFSYNSFAKKIYDYYKTLEFSLGNKESIEFNFGDEVSFDFEEKKLFHFKYEYKSDTTQDIYLYINTIVLLPFQLFFTDSDGKNTTKYDISINNKLLKIVLSNPGTYYLEFYSKNSLSKGGNFTTFLQDSIIDTIDLSQKLYYSNFETRIFGDRNLLPNMYKVKNIKKDIFVYFTFSIKNQNINDFNNPFKICNDNTDECEENVDLYKFLKGNEYTIYINFIRNNNFNILNIFYYPSYSFFPIFDDTIEEKKEGFYSVEEPKIFYIDLKNKPQLYLYNTKTISLAYTNKKLIENNLKNLEFKEITKLNNIIESSDYNYAIIMVIPSENNTPIIIFIISEYITENNIEEYIVKAGKNVLFHLNVNDYNETNSISNEDSLNNDDNENNEEEKWEEEDETDIDDESQSIFYNNLITFSSEIKNMIIMYSEDEFINYDFIVQNYIPIPVYVNTNDKENKIQINNYKPRYAFFVVIYSSLMKYYISAVSEYLKLTDLNKKYPLNIRLNTDLSFLYEYVNFYMPERGKDVFIYIKKYYGNTDIYQCDDEELIDNIKDISILSKPIYSCRNKKSMLNKIINLKESKLITGYLGPNSYYDIYREFDDSNTKIILSFDLINKLRNGAKLLKKDVEYTLDFKADHLIKLENGFDAEVDIYNNNGNKKIDSEHQTAELKGRNIKIKSNNDAMVYFYSKLVSYRQIKIDDRKGKNVEIKIAPKTYFLIDFGFNDYYPTNIININKLRYNNEGVYYLENIYDKLKTRLTDGESLFLYYISFSLKNKIEIDYNMTNLNNPNNEYTFNVIPKNEKNDDNMKSLVINNRNKKKIIFNINYCQKSTHSIKMLYKSSESTSETIIYFDGENTRNETNLVRAPFRLRFESEKDFIFSYSFYDKTDEYLDTKKEWLKEREELTNLVIEKIENTTFNTISFKFYPNYKSSSTRYIIVIAPADENNSFDSFSNPCYITKLVTEKNDNIKKIDVVETGENDLINIEIDPYDLQEINKNNKFIVNIISQELRFGKKLNYYTPSIFYIPKEEEEKEEQIEFGKEKTFNFNVNRKTFYMPYTKKSKTNEMFLLNYKLDKETSINVRINSPNKNEEILSINNEGYSNFLCEDGGKYKITFEKIRNYNLKSSNDNIKIVFKILSTEYPFDLDITKDNIEFNVFDITGTEAPSLKMNIGSLKDDYIEKISIENIDLVQINNNNNGYKSLNFPYYTFEKNTKYSIQIKFNKKQNNKYTLENIKFSHFIKDNILLINNKTYTFDDTEDKFLIIEWKSYENIQITSKKNNPKFFISELTESQSKNLIKEFQNLNFIILKDFNIIKPSNSDYSVLMIQLGQKGTEINFNIKGKEKDNSDSDGNDINEKNDEKKEKKSSNSVVYVTSFSLMSSIIIIVILIFIIKPFEKKKEQNLELYEDLNIIKKNSTQFIIN